MNDRLKKQLYSYKRRLENKKIYTGIYFVVLVVTVFFYGYFGVFRLYKTIEAKRETIAQLQDLNARLEDKANSLQRLRANLERSRIYTASLEEAITLRSQEEEYLVDLVTAAGSAGYKQQHFYITPFEDDTLGVRVSFQGARSQFLSLMKAIESLDRLTTIDELTYSYREEEAQVDVRLEIYHLPE